MTKENHPTFALPHPAEEGCQHKTCEGALTSALEPHCPLIHHASNLMLQTLNDLFGPFNGGRKPIPLLPPAVNAVQFLCSTSLLGFEFLAMLATASHRDRCHDKLGATCFTSAIFSVAVLPEVVPLEIATLKFSLVVKAHLVTAFIVSTILS